ncbi:hypothetical protein BLNAU_5298 [Blattamonas nauphoetae]|uniref:Uncharacterized protein n=1 Tax=Blattamonas nauphoetae TaxID=2049346 RepID=A0ABQ9Y805_9EUKA|nr:hypothetical protein BLNAU_5298 [Blattamonas nauphoetae]
MLVTGEHYNHIEYTNNDKITIPLKEPQKKGQIESVRKHLLFIKAKNGELSIASYSFEASLPIAFLLLDLEGGQTTIFVSTTTGLLF